MTLFMVLVLSGISLIFFYTCIDVCDTQAALKKHLDKCLISVNPFQIIIFSHSMTSVLFTKDHMECHLQPSLPLFLSLFLSILHPRPYISSSFLSPLFSSSFPHHFMKFFSASSSSLLPSSCQVMRIRDGY